MRGNEGSGSREVRGNKGGRESRVKRREQVGEERGNMGKEIRRSKEKYRK